MKTTFYADTDRDSYGDASSTLLACSAPAGYVSRAGDCNDRDASIHPGATEIPGDGIDQNCNGVDDGAICLAQLDLQLYAECSDNPGVELRWRIFNPNNCSVEVDWMMHKTNQKGKLIAPPGDSFHKTKAVSGKPSVLFIYWKDFKGKVKQEGEGSSSERCNVGRLAPTTQAEDKELQKLEVYPMPFEHSFTIRHAAIQESSKLNLRLYSLDGREYDLSAYILQQRDGTVELNVQQISLPNAMFIIQLRVDDGEPIHVRVLKQGK